MKSLKSPRDTVELRPEAHLEVHLGRTIAAVLGTPDEELARLATGGRLDCFEELLARYRDRVYRVCYRCAGNTDDAEDWAQECFVRVFRQLRHFDPGLPFAPWLLRVVSNTCINLAKSRARRAEPWEPQSLNLLAERVDVHSSVEPFKRLMQDENEQAVVRAVSTLPPDLRVALILRVVDELSFRELSEVLGVPLQTAATRVRRASEQVRRILSREAQSTIQQPAIQQPAIQQPAIQQPATQKPASRQPATQSVNRDGHGQRK